MHRLLLGFNLSVLKRVKFSLFPCLQADICPEEMLVCGRDKSLGELTHGGV